MRRNLYTIKCLGKLSLATCFAIPLQSWAENSLDSETGEALETLHIWGTAIQSSSYLNETDFEIKQANHISDLLRSLPGVDVGGAHSLNQRISIRSLDDKDLRITIDGANQNTYMYHHMGNLQIHADILKSVDIEVGTNSVLSGGLGGEVRFETKEAAELLEAGERFGDRLNMGYGDNSGSNTSLSLYSQLTPTLDLLVYHNLVKSDNYDVGGGKILDADGNTVAGTNGRVIGLEGSVEDTLIKLGWDITPNQRLKVGFEHYIDEGDYSYRPDMGLATDIAIANSLGIPLKWPTEFSRDTFTLNYDIDIGDSTTIKSALFTNTSELKRDETGLQQSTNDRIRPSAALVRGEAKNQGFNVLAETILSTHTLTYGLELINYDTDYTARRVSGATRASSESASNRAIFIQDRIALSSLFAFTPGIRYNQYIIDSTVVDEHFSELTSALALEFTPTDNFTTKLSQTQLFQGPEIGEVFTGAGLNDTPNQNIKAETGTNTELSLAFEQSLTGEDRFTTGITLFKTKIKDYIYDYNPIPGSRDTLKDNVGDMDIEGFEFYIGYDFGRASTLLTYSVADSELDAFSQYRNVDLDNDGEIDHDLTNARLDRIQGDTLGFNVDYEAIPNILTLHWDFQVVDDVSAGNDLDFSTLKDRNEKAGFTVHNISARWQTNIENLSLTLGVDNLFDEFYASQSSRTGSSFHPLFRDLYLTDYEPGRNIKVSVAYNF